MTKSEAKKLINRVKKVLKEEKLTGIDFPSVLSSEEELADEAFRGVENLSGFDINLSDYDEDEYDVERMEEDLMKIVRDAYYERLSEAEMDAVTAEWREFINHLCEDDLDGIIDACEGYLGNWDEELDGSDWVERFLDARINEELLYRVFDYNRPTLEECLREAVIDADREVWEDWTPTLWEVEHLDEFAERYRLEG